LRYAILDEGQLESMTLPILNEEVLKREGEVLRLALVEKKHKRLELLGIKPSLKHFTRDILVFYLAKAVEDLVPIES